MKTDSEILAAIRESVAAKNKEDGHLFKEDSQEYFEAIGIMFFDWWVRFVKFVETGEDE